jgi:hypothetical protein
MTSPVIHPSSYRDPSGFIFEKEGVLYRQVNVCFKEHYDHFIQSGCYKHLAEKNLLIPHEQVNEHLTGDDNYYTTLKPEKIDFISYPYEWSFDMLKDAALLTLLLVKEVLSFDMILKDATPYNIQWHKGRLLFIDSLSFEKYKETPWIAYRQFCETFLGPLLLMHYSKYPLQQLQLSWPDGIPLDVIRSLLPGRSRFSLYTYLHIHLHAKISKQKNGENNTIRKLSKQKLLNLISSLELLVKKLRLPSRQSTWSGYYKEASQRNDYLDQKKKIIYAWLDNLTVKTAADLGANEGEFSRLLASKNIWTLSADFDPYCINKLYGLLKSTNEKNIHPLIIDLSSPSPGIGVNNEERDSFTGRTKVDVVLGLALVHHLAIGKNIPFTFIADFFHRIASYLIIEFVPAEDEKVKFMLAQKTNSYTNYNRTGFELSFERYFTIEKKEPIPGSGRTLYLMRNRATR